MAQLGATWCSPGGAGPRDAGYHRPNWSGSGCAHLAADPDADTGSIVIMVSPDGERTMFTDRGANLRLRRADLPGTCSTVRPCCT